MMLVPRRSGFDLFDEMFNDPFFTGNNSYTPMMKTDISEKDGNYVLEMDLPGYTKDEVHAQLHDGYLTIQAKKNESDDTKDTKGRYIVRERRTGSYSRSFYIGDHITLEDIKASFENGTLTLVFPKMTPERTVAQKKYITID